MVERGSHFLCPSQIIITAHSITWLEKLVCRLRVDLAVDLPHLDLDLLDRHPDALGHRKN